MRFAKNRSERSIRRPLILDALEQRICLTSVLPVAAELPDDRCAFGQPEETEVGRAVHSINCFGADLFEYFQKEEGNLFLSPASIATALSMTYLGAAGTTATEIRDVLHIDSEPGIHQSFGALIESFDLASDFDLEFANAMWPSIAVPVKESFTETIQSDYRGTAQNLDYSDPAPRDIINGWVEEKTHGKVVELIDEPLGPNTVMVLTNALYFNAQWEFPFDPRYTSSEGVARFQLADGQFSDVPMMVTPVDAARTTLGDFDVLEMPYKGGATSMVIMVPHIGKANRIAPSLLADVDRWLASSPEPDGFDITLPKFKATVPSELQALLPEMGMPSAFTPGDADFSEMFQTAGPWINKVRHKATLEINEQGTEAAAATSVDLVICFAAGTPILTPDGEKPIEEIKVDDLVLSRNDGNAAAAILTKKVVETFESHQETTEICVGGQRIRTTKSHPFYVRERGWIAASELSAGDSLATNTDQWQPVDSVQASGTAEPVYNFRVADLHTYFVGKKDWGFAVWVHNCCVFDCEVDVDRPFHFLIRDNVSSSILFLGRIEAPLQAETTLIPTVSTDGSQAGDFNGDDQLDTADADLLVSATLDASDNARFDLNDDAAVDDQDLVQWRSLAGAANLPTGVSYPVGDADLDGKIGTADLTRLGEHWQERNVGWSGGDVNADGVVDAIDLNQLGRNWQTDVAAQAIANPRPSRAALAIPIVSNTDIDGFTRTRVGEGAMRHDAMDTMALSHERITTSSMFRSDEASAADEFFAAIGNRRHFEVAREDGHSRTHRSSIRRFARVDVRQTEGISDGPVQESTHFALLRHADAPPSRTRSVRRRVVVLKGRSICLSTDLPDTPCKLQRLESD